MTDAEKMIWVASYATEFVKQYEQEGHQITPDQVNRAIQGAYESVVAIRKPIETTQDAYQMYREVVHGD